MKTLIRPAYIAFGIVIVAVGIWNSNADVGDLFVSLGNDRAIYQYTPTGVQSTFASGIPRPRGVAFDSADNLFVASNFSNSPVQATIFKITPDGTLSAFATLPSNFFAEGLAIDGSDNLFVAGFDNDNGLDASIIKFTPDGTGSTFATLPGQTFDLAFDTAGNLYAGSGTFQSAEVAVYKFMPDGTGTVFIGQSAFAGGGGPVGLAFDRFGNLFVSTESGVGTDSILKFTPDGVKTTFTTSVSWPRGLAFDRAGNLFVAETIPNPPNFILKFPPRGAGSVFASVSLPEFLKFQLRPTPRTPPPTAINFDAIDASANPIGGATLDNYLAQYGVTMSNVTRGSEVVVDDDRRSYGGGVIFASSPHNFLSDYFLNAPNSFTLNFSRPADSVNFTRIAGGPFPTIYASWTATALDAADRVVSSVSEFSPGTANFPARVFTLNGPRIKKVRWDSNGFGIAAFSAVILDDLVLNYPAPGPP